jgi:hypothetical protein
MKSRRIIRVCACMHAHINFQFSTTINSNTAAHINTTRTLTQSFEIVGGNRSPKDAVSVFSFCGLMVINVLLVLGMQYVLGGGTHIGTKSIWMILQGLTFTNNSVKQCNYIGHILHTQNQSVTLETVYSNKSMYDIFVDILKKKSYIRHLHRVISIVA